MASGPTTFVVAQVFTAELFAGNPLAIVSVHGNSLSQKRKSQIAKEFGYSETVFLHDAPDQGMPRKVDIFTENGEEIPFAGHPVIGVAHYIFSQLEKVRYTGAADRDAPPQSAILLTKAGRVPVFYNNYRQLAACTVPHKIHIHSKQVPLQKIMDCQPQLSILPTVEKIKDQTFPVVSIVKGMTFALVDLTDAPEVLGALKKGEAPDYEIDEEWKPTLAGAMYYSRLPSSDTAGQPAIQNIRARMIMMGMEDPGTGSACSALASYLALTSAAQLPRETAGLAEQTAAITLDEKAEHHVFAIEQGVEMGRKCMIAVEVDIVKGEKGVRKVGNIILSGRSNIWMAGQLLGV